MVYKKKNILKILGENDKNIKMRKIWGVVLVRKHAQDRWTRQTKVAYFLCFAAVTLAAVGVKYVY